MRTPYIRKPLGMQLRCSKRLRPPDQLLEHCLCLFPFIRTLMEAPGVSALNFLFSLGAPLGGQGAYLQDGEPDVVEEGL